MITTIILAVLGSTAISSLIQYLISRHDSRHDKLDEIANDLKDLREDFHRGRAVSARIRILDASDEITHGVLHSKEWWNQVLDDVTLYDHYCAANPDFKNAKAVNAIENLQKVYLKRLEANDFI